MPDFLIPTFPRPHPNPEMKRLVDKGNYVCSSPRDCPNCGAPDYHTQVSIEWCTNCGYAVDYWSIGGNEVANALAKRKEEEYYRKQLEDDIAWEQKMRDGEA